MATSRDEEEAEKAYKLAENRFLANDIAGALREAREAQRLFPPLPGIANAVAAYEVHHAASRADGGKWYGILAVGHDYATTSSGAITHEDLKQEYRRLCLVLHPDKNSSAAAEGAFKLLREAWDKLSLLHPPGYAAAPVSCPPPPPTATAQPPEWKPRKPGPRRRTMFCPKCRGSFVTVVNDDVSGVNCVNCNRWVSMLWDTGPAGRAPPPHHRRRETPSPSPPPQQQSSRFPCPARCSGCGVKFTDTVSIGASLLRCGACNSRSFVFVKSPNIATSSIPGVSTYRLKSYKKELVLPSS